jgi:hypothetical protein
MSHFLATCQTCKYCDSCEDIMSDNMVSLDSFKNLVTVLLFVPSNVI